MKYKWILLVLLIPSLSGCFSAKPVSKLEPAEEDYSWDYGQKRLEKTRNGITVALLYNKSTDKHLVFDMEITNQSSSEILIAPEQFFYHCKNQYGTALGETIYAVDPEEQLLNIDKHLSKASSREANQAVLSLVSATAEVTAAIASLDDTPQERAQLAGDIARNRYYREGVRREVEQETWSLREQRAHWADMVLRKTTFEPGFHIGGKVYFERRECAARCTFQIPLADENFTFTYDQILIKP